MTTPHETLNVGKAYERPELAQLWGLAGFQAISRGVYTPTGQRTIFLFVTRVKQDCLTQYRDFLDGDLLFWEGEKGHGSDTRIATASSRGENMHLFYRERHHSPFIYYGKIVLTNWIRHDDRPSEFAFKVASIYAQDFSGENMVAESTVDYGMLSEVALNNIDRKIVTKTRGIAQRFFRGNLLKLWDGACAVTGVQELRVLRSSHIKPWAKSTIEEKVDKFNGLLLIPNLDALFNEGLITFKEDGSVSVSNKWDHSDQRRMHITDDTHLRKIFPASLPYLDFHRQSIFLH